MELQKKIKNLGLEELQVKSLELFLHHARWKKMDISSINQLKHEDLMEKVGEYAKTLFENREQFISSINDLIQQLLENDLLIVEENKSKNKLYCQVDKLYDSTEMKIKLLKFLQGRGSGKSRAAISEHFNISDTTLGNRIQELRSSDNYILGTKIQIELERKTNLYDSTCHPLFLALNLTEVYSMLVGLMRAERLVLDDNTITSIIKDIVSQLTDYAKGVLKESGLDIDAYSTDEPRSFRDEATIDHYYHMMKTRTLCRIWLYGRDDSVVGRFKLDSIQRKRFLFCPEDGREPFQLDGDEIKELKKEEDI